ncbi:MAG: nucleoside triphosphate pyrophosphohydrolase [Acidobacteria bacterium]|nr:MAG: nucleoside triphosphate pyrophosphohydrolase [Acidobacteriota bacterium]
MKGGKFAELVALVDRLRGPEGCPWDREQTFDTLKPMLLEEAYEVLEALDSGTRQELCRELGDLLFQIVFLAKVAESEGEFQIDDVVEEIVAKMIRRHPHVFSQAKVSSSAEVLKNWEIIKQEERAEGSQGLVKSSTRSILEGVPTMPALLAAHKLTSKAARVGFDWSHLDEIVLKLQEEIEELREALELKPPESFDSKIEQEVGDLLFVAVNIARFLKIDPETALRKTNRKFAQRFQYIESSLRKAGKHFGDSNIEEMEGLWQEAKKVI